MAENGNNKFLGLVGIMLFAAVGVILSSFTTNTFIDLQGSSTGVIKDIIDFFVKNPGIFAGILWFLICLIVYYGVGYAFPNGDNVGPISPLFLLMWLFTNIGLVIGFLLWLLIDGQSITLDLDLFINALMINFVTSLGPTFAGALGIVNKLK